jgi:hypothetical protein
MLHGSSEHLIEAIDPNLGETMGVRGRAVNLIRTMHEQKARTSKEVAKQK